MTSLEKIFKKCEEYNIFPNLDETFCYTPKRITKYSNKYIGSIYSETDINEIAECISEDGSCMLSYVIESKENKEIKITNIFISLLIEYGFDPYINDNNSINIIITDKDILNEDSDYDYEEDDDEEDDDDENDYEEDDDDENEYENDVEDGENDDVENVEDVEDDVKNDDVENVEDENVEDEVNENDEDDEVNDNKENDEVENDEVENDEVENENEVNEVENDEVENDEVENDEVENENEVNEVENDEVENDEVENENEVNEVENDEVENDEVDGEAEDNIKNKFEKLKYISTLTKVQLLNLLLDNKVYEYKNKNIRKLNKTDLQDCANENIETIKKI
jgi:hypothetical protein